MISGKAMVMELKLGVTVSYFLWSLASGVSLAFVYDFLRSFRRLVKDSTIRINAEDVIFFVISSLVLFFISYFKNNGAIRFQGFAGFLLGFWGYRKAFSDKIVQGIVFLCRIFGIVAKKIFRIVFYPLKMVFRLISKPFWVIGWYTFNGIRKGRKLKKPILLKKGLLNRKMTK